MALGPYVRLLRHDKLQLELKLEHPVRSVIDQQSDASLDVWFYLPPAVGVSEATHPPEDFYADLRTMTRLRTPEVPLDELSQTGGHRSPLSALALLVTRIGVRGPTRHQSRAIRQEARLVSACYRSACRRPLQDILIATDSASAIVQLLTLARSSDRIACQYRALRERLSKHKLHREVRRCLGFVDEYLSMQVENTCLKALHLSESIPPADGLAAAQAELRAVAHNEATHREQQGWRTVLSADSDKDADAAFLDQASLLKKYVSAVLYLDDHQSRANEVAEQIVLGFAAALAMTWTVGLQVFTFFALGLELSAEMGTTLVWTFIAVAVVGYILKDRLKATVGQALARRLPRLLSDRRFVIRYGTGRIATTSERMRFVSGDTVPEEIQRTRLSTVRNTLVAEATADVLHYSRQIRLHPREATASFPRFDGIKEVLRFNVWRWIRTMAASRKRLLTMTPDGKLIERRAPNLYIVDLLLRLESPGPDGTPETTIGNARVYLNRRGIVRVEPVDTD